MSDKQTAEMWERLPFLISRKTVLRVSGLSKRELRKLVDAGVLHRQVSGKRTGKYFKTELEHVCKVKVAQEEAKA